MSVFYNLKGTTQPFFQIGKQGATLYPGAADPTVSYTVIDGDIWLPPNRQVKVRSGGAWETILFDNIEISNGRITHTPNTTEPLEIKFDDGMRLIDLYDDIVAEFSAGTPFGIDGWLTFQAALGGSAYIGVMNNDPVNSDVGIQFNLLGTGTLSVGDGVAYAGNIASDGDIVVKKYVDDSIDAIFSGLNNNSLLYLDNTGILATSTALTFDGGTLSIDNISIDGNTISATNTNGDVVLVPNGTGEVAVGNQLAATTTMAGAGDLIVSSEGDITLLADSAGKIIIGNAVGTAGTISGPDEKDLVLEGGTAAAAIDGGDLYLRGGDATGTGADGTVFLDRGGVVAGAATGGSQGVGTVNAEGLFIDGVPVRAWTNTVTAISVTALPWERIFVTAAAQTITLPITPADGVEVTVSIVGTFTDTVIARNGQSIMGLAENMTVDQSNVTVHLVYVNSILGWRVI